jgi:hypothetical protein
MRTLIDITDSPFLGRGQNHFPQPNVVLNGIPRLGLALRMAPLGLSSTFSAAGGPLHV